MVCFYPLDAWQLESGDIVFAERGAVKRALTLPCGQCFGCRLERSRQWSIRLMHQASLQDINCFVTLTYDDEFVPMGHTLVYDHFQKFMKRLRRLDRKNFKGNPADYKSIRFYMCGEYGETYKRPHYHALLFGVSFSDRVVISGDAAEPLYRSATLDRLWGLGFCSIGEVTIKSAAYVARYCIGKRTGRDVGDYYHRVDLLTGEMFEVEPEFSHMSLPKGGLGGEWFRKYKSDVYGLTKDYCIIDGKKVKPPRFYDKLLASMDADVSEAVSFARYEKSLLCTPDSSYDRLRVRETVARARMRNAKRKLE